MPFDIYLYEDIEQGLASRFVKDLNSADGDDITLHVNSYGGDVFEGKTIMHALRSYEGTVTAMVEGVAASAASFIVVGGADRVVMNKGSRLMIHNALSMAFGNANDLDKLSEQLRSQSLDIANIYAERSGKPVEEWLDAMDKETWFTDEQAVEAGLADAVGGDKVLASTSVRSRVSNLISAHGAKPSRELLTPRAAAPPPPLARRSESAGNKLKEGDTVGIFDELAAKYGKSPEDVEKAFAGFFNESVQISGEVEVTYPNDVKIVPTEKIEVEPVIGDKPAEDAEGAEPVAAELVDAEAAGDSAAVQLAKQAGLTFAMGDVAEGFTAEVNEGGVVTITAPSGAEVGSTVDFTVLVNETPVALGVTVRSLSEETEEEQESGSESVDPVPAPPVDPALENKITVDVDTWNELQARAKFGDEAYVKAQSDAREKKVDEWIRDGRISAGLRGKAIAAIHRDEEAAVALYGSNPKNTVPRGEVGYGRQSGEGVDPDAAARRAKPNPFPKPKF